MANLVYLPPAEILKGLDVAATKAILQAVITTDSQPIRFEGFCASLLGELEGAVVVPTSTTYDLGRDGRTVGRGKKLYVCCSLRDDIEAKSVEDIERIFENPPRDPHKIYFCSSQPLTEHRLNAIEKEIRKLIPKDAKGIEVEVLGAFQIVDLSVRFSSHAERSYKAEIADCISVLRADEPNEDDDGQRVAMTLALMTAGHENSLAIREHVYKIGILSALESGPKGLGACCRDVGGYLKLAQSLPPEAVEPHLTALNDDGLIRGQGDAFSITKDGREFLAKTRAEIPMTLMEGRSAIRVRLEAALGQKLADEQFAEIWQVIQDKLSWMFYERGVRLIEEVAELLELEVEGAVSAAGQAPDFVKELAQSVAEKSSLPDQRKELAVAIEDLFSEREGHAAEWLVRVCAGFVIACSLGLEAMCKEAIQKLAANTILLLDTDVVLSLLCPGEPDYEAAQAMRRKWKGLGGSMLIADSVAHEVSYHASIAQYDYDAVRGWLPGTEEDRLRLIENAFVRGFATLLARREAKPTQWGAYIKQYLPKNPGEFGKVSSYMLSEYNIGRLPERAAAEKLLEKQAVEYLFEKIDRARLNTRERRNARDKARRDAAMYAATVSYLRSLKDNDPGASCLLVSSARRLAELENRFRQTDEEHFVVPPSTVIYLLSLMPDVSLGIGALKSFLFDENRLTFSSDLQRTVLRIIHDSQQMSIAWARRGTLMREFRGRMLDRAHEQGLHGEEKQKAVNRMEAQVMNPTHRTQTIELLKDALDSVAADSAQEQQMAELRRKVAQLEAENLRLKAKTRTESSEQGKNK